MLLRRINNRGVFTPFLFCRIMKKLKQEIKLNQDTKNVGEVATLDNDVNTTELTEEETQGRF